MKNAKEHKQSFIQIHTEKLAKQARKINMSIDWEDTSHWNSFNISLVSLTQQEEIVIFSKRNQKGLVKMNFTYLLV